MNTCFICGEIIDTMNGDDETIYIGRHCHQSCLEEFLLEPEDENKLQIIANLIREGFTSGFAPTWKLYYDTLQIDDAEIIADLVEQGCISGHYPNWSIKIK